VLAITSDAAEAINGLVSSAELPEDGGLRISPTSGAAGPGLELSLTPVPGDEDEVVEESGAHVFLEPGVVDPLEDKVLDAEVEAGQVRFSLRESEAD
jgi:iron-sulfur cluster assembly protein